MTLSYSERYTSYSPTTSTTEFLVGFPIFSADDLTVVVDGVEIEGYSVSASFGGGRSTDAKVLLNTPVSSVLVEIYGDRLPARNADYSPASDKLATMVSMDLDVIVAVLQELHRDNGRYIRMPLGSDGARDLNESDVDRAGKFLGFDGSGNLTASLSGPTGTPVSAYMAGLLAASTASAARTVMNVGGAFMSKSANYAVTTADDRVTIACTAAITITLPAAATVGVGFMVRLIAQGGIASVAPSGVDQINGLGSLSVLDGASVILISTGAGWSAIVGQQIGGASQTVDGLPLSQGDLLMQGALGMERLGIGSIGSSLRVNAAGTQAEWGPLGWEAHEIVFAGLTSPTTIETNTLEDGYEYRLVFNKVQMSSASTINIKAFKEDDGGYHPDSLQVTDSTANPFLGYIDFSYLRNVTDFKFLRSTVQQNGSISAGTDDSASANGSTRFGGWGLATAQKISKLQILGSVAFSATGSIILYRRPI